MMRRFASFLVLAAFILAAPACGGGGGGGDGNAVSATLSEYSIALDPMSTTPGSVTFNIENTGGKVHEFVIFKTDLAEDALPMTGDEVDEEGEGLTLVDEQEDIAPGSGADLSVDLDTGSYVMVCNLTGHYSKGMHAAFTVG